MARQPFNPNLIKTPEKKSARIAGGRLTVSQVTSLVKEAIESELPTTLHVVGEISNFKRHSSGHLYLTLKDRNSELSCVMWRSGAAKLKFEPDDGMEVVATGCVEVFERAGRYQLYIRKLEPLGVGALELAFRQLCEKLSSEGLFDESHKKPLPACPRRIAIVTSPTGAAIGDMLRTIGRRYPCACVLIYPVRVQGPGAAEEIADAIKRINANNETLGGIDVMIVGRGGGSLEDLWAFNEEIVARAIHASFIPIISAVGHEIDVTIADMVADVRAATPTAAAELAVPVLEELLDELDSQRQRLSRALRTMLQLARARWTAVTHRSVFRTPFDLVRRRAQLIDELAHRTHRRVTTQTHGLRQRLDHLESIVQRIAPHTLLRSRTAKLHHQEKCLRWAMSTRLVNAERATHTLTSRLERGAPVHVVPRKLDELKRLHEKLIQSMRHQLIYLTERATHVLASRLERAAPAHVVQRKMDELKHLHEKLVQSMRYQLAFRTERLVRQAQRLSAMSYESVLGRGYSITRIAKGREIVRTLDQLRDRQKLVTEVAGGAFESEVINLNQLELFE